jgi:hypothetical protein
MPIARIRPEPCDAPACLLDLEFTISRARNTLGPHDLTKYEGEKPLAFATAPLKSAQR